MCRIYFTILLFLASVSANSQSTYVALKISDYHISGFHFPSESPPVNLALKINVKTHENLLKQYDANPIFSPVLKPVPPVNSFLDAEIKNYLMAKGLNINSQSPYILHVLVDQFEVNYLSGSGWTGSVKIDVTLTYKKQQLFSQSTMGFQKIKSHHSKYEKVSEAITKAFLESLDAVNWQSFGMKLQGSSPKAEISNKPITQKKQAEPIIKTKTESVKLADIDQRIPFGSRERNKTFAVVIGNEKYDNEIEVQYAANDARIFCQYLTRTLRVPRKQVHLVMNATYGKMLGELDWLRSVSKAFGKDASIIFYYAGHGMPDESTRNAYILPVDGNASQVRTAIRTDELYNTLTANEVKKVLVFFDACFSGAGRDGMLASGRGVRIKPKNEEVKGNIIVFSAASGDETAHPFEEKHHGLFSYYLMKKIRETKGGVSLEELYNYIRTNVYQKSVINGREQNPKINVSPGLREKWQMIKF